VFVALALTIALASAASKVSPHALEFSVSTAVRTAFSR
jgi:hypothetical protein